MSLTKDWMTEDNLSATHTSRVRRAEKRALEACVTRAVLFSDPRRVGVAFERAKSAMPPDEVAAIQSITRFPYAYSVQA